MLPPPCMTSYEAKAIAALIILQIAVFLYIAYRLRFMDGGQVKERKIPMLQLVTTGVRHLANFGGVKVAPDVDRQLERNFTVQLVAFLKDAQSRHHIVLTEYNMPALWTRAGGHGKPAMRKMLQRFEGLEVLRRQNPDAKNSPRVLRNWRKLVEIASPSPATTSPTAKTGEKRG